MKRKSAGATMSADDEEESDEYEDEHEDEDVDEDEDEETVIDRHDVLDAATGYKFSFKEIEDASEGFGDYRSDVCGTVLVQAEDKTWSKVGTLNGSVLNRRQARMHGGFHTASDEHSQELANVAMECCNDNGSLRFHNIPELDETEHRNCSEGLFLHIESVKLSPEHRGKGVGPRFVDALLCWPTLTQHQTDRDWTFAAIVPGTLREDGGIPVRGRAAFSRTPEELALDEAKILKVCQAWARVGFKQCKFASDTWYLVRANHTPGKVLAKAEVANVTRTKLAREPAIEDLVPADLALLTAAIGPIDRGLGGFELTVDAVMTLGDRCDKLGLAVAAGGDATRARLLNRLVGQMLNQHGVSDSDLCSLVQFIIETLKADVNAADSAGVTPLHIAALAVSSPLVVPLLLKYGANKDARTLEGRTPFGTWHEGYQSSCDILRTFGLDHQHHNGSMDPARLALANKSFELDVAKMRLLIPDGVLAHLTDGLMSPRMYRRVRIQAEIMADMAHDEIDFTGFVNNEPKSRSDVYMVSGFDHVPCEVTGDEVFKSFAKGFEQCLAAMRNVLDSGKLPVPQLVVHELNSHSDFDARYTSHYFDRGGKVEFAIDAVLAFAKDACQDGSYEEEQGLWEEGEEPSLVVPELDENFDLIRACLLGPHFKRGPFRER